MMQQKMVETAPLTKIDKVLVEEEQRGPSKKEIIKRQMSNFDNDIRESEDF
jgi:hypothetical protein